MTESAAPKVSLSAQQLNDKLLALILSMDGPQDLTAQNIERRTGLKIEPNPEDPSGFFSTGSLPEGWFYSLISVEPVPGTPHHALLLNMGHAAEGYTDRTPVCVGLEHYRSALTSAGFKESQRPPRLGTEYRFFRSGKVNVRVELQGRTTRYDEDLCVSRVFVSGKPQG
ncbi:hypothetical protein GLE_0137 [Lysobacter enzymogenes]|uniref:Uncharacterized protein n=1 Tax=Lysobacter enzymogenes TaxID=69 RepID=A0A0S2DB11_LYSEN|nr:hypothetical protein [Lysobacter enzymogenes]ALN55496.1 hypothetical protein GLE_0137 [Lysobacter enzymogenes]QCW24560.1 hypothetical protein FE772_01590 [Lysobacter enzymogenes]UZW60476.1 hypothetical protein BV903_024990 [Lysobacter enzymogenes]